MKLPLVTLSTRRLSKSITFAALLVAISGCSWLGDRSWWRDRSLDYQQARLSAPLAVPESLQPTTTIPATTQQTTLKIPSLSVVSAQSPFVPTHDYPVPRTQVLIKSQFGNALQLHNQQGQLWIESQLAADDLRTMTQRFIEKQSYLSAVDVSVAPTTASLSLSTSTSNIFMQTDWAPVRAIPVDLGFWAKAGRLLSWSSTQVRYQWTLTAGSVAESGYALRIAEQRVESKSLAQSADNFVASPVDEAALKRLNGLTEQLFEFYSLLDNKTAVPVVASNQKPRVELIKDGNDYPVLVIEQAFVQAWETVGESLQNIKVRVEDLNRTTGVFYLRLKSNTIQLPEAPLVLRVSRNQKGTQVTLEQDDETLPPKAAAEQLLQALFKDMQTIPSSE
jgi:outer membrane protein assembly factor BamC